MFQKEYDEKSPIDIERHAKQLENHSLNEYLKAFPSNNEFQINAKNKGRFGQLVERILFDYENNSDQNADFKEAGVELKVSPLLPKDSGFTTKERLVLTMINFNTIVLETWDTNSLIKKMQHILLMFYLHETKHPFDLIFKLVSLWRPSQADLFQMEQDWNTIVSKIRAGEAHKISEGDTSYLGACTKGKNKEDKVAQPYSNELATKRAFSFKSSYLRSIYFDLLEKKNDSVTIAPEGNFESKILAIFKNYIGKSLEYFITANQLKTTRVSKNFNSQLVDEFLTLSFGVKSDKIKEFQKAGIKVKTIMLQDNGIPKEHMSFKQIQYREIINQNWEDFELNKDLSEGRYLWIVFKAKTKYTSQSKLPLSDIIIEKVMFWNMPYEDLQVSYKKLWEDTKQKVINGDYTHFLKATEHSIGHIRPKGKNNDDTMLTPQGTKEAKKCFWINAEYIAEQVRNASD